MVVVKEFNKRCPRAGCDDSDSCEATLKQMLQYQEVDVAVINDCDDPVERRENILVRVSDRGHGIFTPKWQCDGGLGATGWRVFNDQCATHQVNNRFGDG